MAANLALMGIIAGFGLLGAGWVAMRRSSAVIR